LHISLPQRDVLGELRELYGVSTKLFLTPNKAEEVLVPFSPPPLLISVRSQEDSTSQFLYCVEVNEEDMTDEKREDSQAQEDAKDQEEDDDQQDQEKVLAGKRHVGFATIVNDDFLFYDLNQELLRKLPRAILDGRRGKQQQDKSRNKIQPSINVLAKLHVNEVRDKREKNHSTHSKIAIQHICLVDK